MKKLMTIFAACICLVLMCACGADTSTPEGTVKKAMKCLMEKDYEGYVDLIQFRNADEMDAEKLTEKKQQILALLQEKASKDFENKGGIQSYEMSDAKLDGDKAEVEATITYGNGDTKKQEFQLVKTADGDWKLDAGK